MAVITLSRQYGSRGTEIAQRVSKLLGYRYVDKEIIALAASEAGLPLGEEVEFTEHHSELRQFFDRLLFPGPYIVAQMSVQSGSADQPTVTVEELDEAEALNFVRTAIHEVYKEGNAIIVGRGGQAVLQKLPGVLHVRVEAPMKDRILRIQNDTQLKLEDAHSLAVKRDRKTADYLREVFDIDWHDPLLYHLVINSGKLSVDEAAHVIVAAIGQLGEASRPELVD